MIDADFEITADIDVDALVAPEAEVWFANNSDDDEVITTNTWYFDDGESETNNDDQVMHVYTEPNDCYQPYLVVYARDLPECRDTAFIDCIKVDDRSSLEVPNIFTPNGDNQNDFFQVEAKTLETFHGIVVNRWGNTIYEWDNYQDEEAGWDGKLKGGAEASPGVYFYIIKATGIDGYEYELTGPFHLTR
jgi:gliding motility-associated-like protein